MVPSTLHSLLSILFGGSLHFALPRALHNRHFASLLLLNKNMVHLSHHGRRGRAVHNQGQQEELLQEGDLVAIVPFLGAKRPRTTAKSIRLTYS